MSGVLKSRFSTYEMECGCDEAGRGCLAGDVFAAAVILPKGFKHDLLNDSKKLSPKTRNELRSIIEHEAIAWSVARGSVEEIDKTNILKATILAMHRAIDGLTVQPSFITVDGNRFTPYKEIPFQTIVKGDNLYTNIAAASILAKTHRDAYMEQLHQLHPHYHWADNKAYGTKKHREVIKEIGLSPYHRKSFKIR